MRFLKQLSLVLTITAVFALPFGIMGCAQDSATPAADESTEADTGEGTNLGEADESGSQL